MNALTEYFQIANGQAKHDATAPPEPMDIEDAEGSITRSVTQDDPEKLCVPYVNTITRFRANEYVEAICSPMDVICEAIGNDHLTGECLVRILREDTHPAVIALREAAAKYWANEHASELEAIRNQDWI